MAMIEVFTAGCPCCDEALQVVRGLTGAADQVSVLDMRKEDVARRARDLGVRSVPAVVIDGRLAQCCVGRGVDEETLRNAGIGQAG
jgi:glutaredoxin 3